MQALGLALMALGLVAAGCGRDGEAIIAETDPVEANPAVPVQDVAADQTLGG